MRSSRIKAVLDGSQAIDFVSEILGFDFQDLILFDILLHRRDIDIDIGIADIFSDEGTDIAYRREGDSLLEKTEILVRQISKSFLSETLIIDIRVKETEMTGLVIASHIGRKLTITHRADFLGIRLGIGIGKAVSRERRIEIEVMFIDRIGNIDIKDHT